MVKNTKKEDFDDRVVEIEDSEPSVAPSKGGKAIMIAGMILGIALVINFFVLPLILGDKEKSTSQDIIVEERGKANVISEGEIPQRETFVPPVDDGFSQSFGVPSVPELPELPELSAEVTKGIKQAEEENKKQEEELQKRLAEERKRQELVTQDLEEKIKELEVKLSNTTFQQQTQQPILQPQTSAGTKSSGALLGLPLDEPEDSESILARKRALAQRKATAMLTKTGAGGPKSSFIDGGGIILSQENTVNALQESVTEVTAQRVKDLKTTILQGKLIYAILETAINTDFEGTLRGIVTRDVYAEKGNNILVSKGSRLIGSYGSSIVRGQHRLMINWTRIIRTDGVEIAINSQTTDQFGRTGLQGDVDNKYVEILGNSLLTSILTIATAVATEEVTNSTGISSNTSTDTGSSTQTSGKASDYAIIDATQSFLESAEDLVEDLSKNAKPTMRIPQGTKLLVFVNQDLSIPPIEE